VKVGDLVCVRED